MFTRGDLSAREFEKLRLPHVCGFLGSENNAVHNCYLWSLWPAIAAIEAELSGGPRHRATFVIDPYNRLSDTDENDNVATLTVDGYAAPVFDITFVPIESTGEFPYVVVPDIYMAGIADLLPIEEYRARVERVLDLSDRNIAASNLQLINNTALEENARVEHDRALLRAMTSLMKDDTQLF